MTPKEEVLNTISTLPEDAGIEEIMYRLYVLDKIHKGQDAVKNHKVISIEDLNLMCQHRIGWARTYLLKAGLLESNKRGYLNITKRGKDFLARNPQNITNKDLEQFTEFLEFKSSKNTTATTNDKTNTEETPEEVIVNSITELNSNIASELLFYLKDVSPNSFERLVVESLVKMGYGGSRKAVTDESRGALHRNNGKQRS